MSRTVWKYALPIGSEQTLDLPGRIVHVGSQGGWPMLWVETELGLPVTLRTFRVFATGEPIPDGWEHRGTVQDRPLVWHIYERVIPWPP